ncbi:MAG: RHS repeat-associated core domain-containing protein [Elusimicrobiota bacterium]
MGRKHAVVVLVFSLLGGLSLPADAGLRVTPFSGALRLERVDVEFEGSRVPLDLIRYYQGNTLLRTPFGRGWRHSFQYGILVREAEKELVLFQPNGARTVFMKAEGGRYDAVPAGGTAYVRGERVKVVLRGGLTLLFAESGKLVEMINVYGQSVKLTYSGRRLQEVHGPFGQWLRFAYGPGGLIAEVESSSGHIIAYVYLDGQLAGVMEGGETLERYESEMSGAISRAVYRSYRDLQWQISYDKEGRVTRLVQPQGYVERYAYESGGRKAFVTISPTGGRTVRTFSADKSRLTEEGPGGGKKTVDFDTQSGQPLKMRAADGGETEYFYDKQGRLKEVRDPLGRRMRLAYSKDSYRLVKVSDGRGGSVKFTYDKFGNWTHMADSVRGTAERRFDAQGRTVYEKDFDGRERRQTFTQGWVPDTMVDFSGKRIHFVFGPQGQITHYAIDNSEPVEVSEVHDLLDLQAAVRDLVDLNTAGEPVILADGKSAFMVDPAGHVVLRRFPSGSERRYTYDHNGHVVRVEQDGAVFAQSEYNAAGQLAKYVYPDGAAARFTYDAGGRLAAAVYPGDAAESYEYDKRDRLIKAVASGITREYAYRDDGMRISEKSSFENAAKAGGSAAYVYGKDGRLAAVTAHGIKTAYAWDAKSGALQSLTDKELGAFRYEYSSAGFLERVTYPNGTDTRYELLAGRRLKMTVSGGKKTLLEIIAHYDEEARIIDRERDGVKGLIRYETDGQLGFASNGAHSWRYRYDAWGNRVHEQANSEKTASRYAADGRLLNRGDTRYGWDARGNLESRQDAQGRSDFSFDRRDRLVRMRGADGRETRYAYYHNGLLAARSGGGEDTYFHYAGLNPAAELAGDGRVLRRYLCSPDFDDVLAYAEGEKKYYVHRDERGNVALITDEQGGVAARLRYGPFGSVIEKTGSLEPPLMFAGLRKEGPFYYARMRFYDPEAGRFISRDPVHGSLFDPLSTNPYLYVRNDPFNRLDPLGTKGFFRSMWSSLTKKGAEEGSTTIARIGGGIMKEKLKGVGSKGAGKIAQGDSAGTIWNSVTSTVGGYWDTAVKTVTGKESVFTYANFNSMADDLVTAVTTVGQIASSKISGDGINKTVGANEGFKKVSEKATGAYKIAKGLGEMIGGIMDGISGKIGPGEMVFGTISKGLGTLVDTVDAAGGGKLGDVADMFKGAVLDTITEAGKSLDESIAAFDEESDRHDATAKGANESLIGREVNEIDKILSGDKKPTLDELHEISDKLSALEDWQFKVGTGERVEKIIDKLKKDIDDKKKEILGQGRKVAFVDEDAARVRAAKRGLEDEKARSEAAADRRIAEQAEREESAAWERMKARQEAWQSLAEGMQGVATGLQAARAGSQGGGGTRTPASGSGYSSGGSRQPSSAQTGSQGQGKCWGSTGLSKAQLAAGCKKLNNGVDREAFRQPATAYGVGLHCPREASPIEVSQGKKGPFYRKDEAQVMDRAMTPMRGMPGATARVKIKDKDYYTSPDSAHLFRSCEVVMIKKLFTIPGGNYK